MLTKIKLINDNCLNAFKEIENESVDLVIIDPPYRVLSGGNKNKNAPKGILKKNDSKIFKHNDIDFDDYINELYRVLKNDTHCYIFTNFLNLHKLLNSVEVSKFKMHNLLVWKKNNVLPNRWYMKNVEYILFLRKGKAKTINNKSSKTVLEFDNILGNKTHPSEKPVDLIELLVSNSSNEGDLVLDCFMGSGSTGVACKNLNRNFIGIEIDEEYFCIAKENIKNVNKD